jgi:uncharacterized membrane protein
MANLFYLIFTFFYVFLLPGYALCTLFCKKLGYPERLALSLGLSVIVIPLVSFSVAMLLGTFVKESIVFYIATAINLAGLISILSGRLKR